MVLLASSDEAGLAYVETASLDGERNLKLKQSKFEIKEYIKKNGIQSVKGTLTFGKSSNPSIRCIVS